LIKSAITTIISQFIIGGDLYDLIKLEDKFIFYLVDITGHGIVGEDGFKKYLRHDNFIPNTALLDPDLTTSCPASITAASGLDAITQLLGAYTSTTASPMTDSLSLKALQYAGESLVPAATDKGDDPQVRAGMAYASLICFNSGHDSGIKAN
ncbi:MAG: iron-containing alcohol dehydrogenase, partial [Halanaerobacter sp.]